METLSKCAEPSQFGDTYTVYYVHMTKLGWNPVCGLDRVPIKNTVVIEANGQTLCEQLLQYGPSLRKPAKQILLNHRDRVAVVLMPNCTGDRHLPHSVQRYFDKQSNRSKLMAAVGSVALLATATTVGARASTGPGRESTRKANDTRLEEAQEEMEELRNRLQLEIVELKTQVRKRDKAIQDCHQKHPAKEGGVGEDLAALTKKHDAELARLADENSDVVKKHEAEIAKLTQEHADTVSTLTSAETDGLAALKGAHAAALKAERQKLYSAQEEIKDLKEELGTMEVECNDQLADIKAQADVAVDNLKAQIQALTQASGDSGAAMQQAQGQMKELRKQLKHEQDKLSKCQEQQAAKDLAHLEAEKKLNQDWQARMDQQIKDQSQVLKQSGASEVAVVSAELASLKDAHRALQKTHEQALQSLQEHIALHEVQMAEGTAFVQEIQQALTHCQANDIPAAQKALLKCKRDGETALLKAQQQAEDSLKHELERARKEGVAEGTSSALTKLEKLRIKLEEAEDATTQQENLLYAKAQDLQATKNELSKVKRALERQEALAEQKGEHEIEELKLQCQAAIEEAQQGTNDALEAQNQKLQKERDEAVEYSNQCQAAGDELKAKFDTLSAEHQQKMANCGRISGEYESLQEQFRELQTTRENEHGYWQQILADNNITMSDDT